MQYSPFAPNIKHCGLRLLVVLLACVWSCATFAAAHDYNLPSLGEPSNTTLSPAQEKRIGARVYSQLLRADQMVDDVELHRYISHVGDSLVKQTSHSPNEFHFFVAAQPVINAFALPGGYIGINSGLILDTDSESELAGVMAHEISHVTQRHIARQLQDTKGTQWAALAALLGAAIAAGGDPDAVEAAITGSISIAQQQQVTYTRQHELEADRIGIKLLAKAGYDPEAMANFFETLQRHARLYGNKLPQILLTHPVNNTRIAEARSRASNYPATHVKKSPDYAIMKERLRVLTSSHYSALRTYYRRLGAPDNGSDAQKYGYAVTLIRSGQAAQAVKPLQALVNAHPDQVHYVLALARAQGHALHSDQALTTLKTALSRFSSDPAVLLQYATALMHNNQLQDARSFLLDHPHFADNSYHAQALLARIAGEQGKLGETYYRQAMYRRLRGAYIPAIRKLRAILHGDTTLRKLDRDRLDALQDQIISQCKAAWPGNQCINQVLHPERQSNTLG